MVRRYSPPSPKPSQNKQEKGPSDKKSTGTKKATTKESESEGE